MGLLNVHSISGSALVGGTQCPPRYRTGNASNAASFSRVPDNNTDNPMPAPQYFN
jgi:hypothetical protein